MRQTSNRDQTAASKYEIIMWDWKERVDFDHVNDAIKNVFDGQHAPRIHQVATGQDCYAIMVTSVQITPEQVQAAWEADEYRKTVVPQTTEGEKNPGESTLRLLIELLTAFGLGHTDTNNLSPAIIAAIRSLDAYGGWDHETTGGWPDIKLYRGLRQAIDAGYVEQSSAYGVECWRLTDEGVELRKAMS